MKKVKIGKVSFFVTGHDAPGAKNFWDSVQKGDWERETYGIFDQFMDKEHSYIDIGAWIGPTVLYGCQVAKHCYAIEPDNIAFKILVENINLNLGLKSKISLFNGCISNVSGDVKLGTKANFGDCESSITLAEPRSHLIVKSLTLEDFVEMNDIRDCNFIKMDIEGGESLVLPNSKTYLQKNTPTLFLSLHPFLFRDREQDSKQIIDVLKTYKHLYLLDGRHLKPTRLHNMLLSPDSHGCSIIATNKWNSRRRLKEGSKKLMVNKLHSAFLRFVTNREQTLYYRAMRRLFGLKPVLSYLEVHLADHCNMNCSGCSHFSPLAPESFANIEQFNHDMKRLNQLVANIKVIHLLGGEPLLHPAVNMFLNSTRTFFPRAKIYLVTNGILLSSMPREFWESCTRNSISIEVTLYPPLFGKEPDFVQLAKSEGIALNVVKRDEFRFTSNSKGDSELERGFRRCRKRRRCPILVQGKVYPCALPAFAHYFNEAFGTNIPNTGFVDLYGPEVTGWKVLSRIEKSSEACRFCTDGWEEEPTHVWAKSCCSQKEWDIASQK